MYISPIEVNMVDNMHRLVMETTEDGIMRAVWQMGFKVDAQPEADYFRVNCWNALAETCAKYLAKGKKVAVTGSVSLSKREHDGKFYASMEVFAEEVEFISPKDTGNQPQEVEPDADFPF